MTVGEKIKSARLSAGMTQKELSSKIGIDDGTLRKYESGRLNPKVETLEKIATGIGIDPSAFSDSELSITKAMHHLFRIYETYGGELKNGKQIKAELESGSFDQEQVYLSFGDLHDHMTAWLAVYERFQNEIKNAEKITDDYKKKSTEKEAEKSFEMWMQRYQTNFENDK